MIINYFLKTKTYDNLSNFLAKKLFKIFKIFFVETNLSELPDNNYKIEKNNLINEIEKGKLFQENNIKPYITYPHLLDLLTIIQDNKKKIKIFDYGAGNLNLFFYLKRKFKDFDYFFYDQKKVNMIVNEYKLTNSLNNLHVEADSVDSLDLVYFGSSLQYISNYELQIKKFFKKTKYFLISQSPFFEKPSGVTSIVVKQVNMHPFINYLYLLNLNKFVDFMEKNNYFLVEKNLNKVTKFLNFKNFDQKYDKLDMYDLLFKYRDND